MTKVLLTRSISVAAQKRVRLGKVFRPSSRPCRSWRSSGCWGSLSRETASPMTSRWWRHDKSSWGLQTWNRGSRSRGLTLSEQKNGSQKCQMWGTLGCLTFLVRLMFCLTLIMLDNWRIGRFYALFLFLGSFLAHKKSKFELIEHNLKNNYVWLMFCSTSIM